MPRYRIDLTDAWAKVDRAKMHIGDLRSKITEKLGKEPFHLPLKKEFEWVDSSANLGAFVFRIDHLIEADSEWGLIAGDAIHNVRSALDCLAWQLALRYCNGVLPPKEATFVQFPVVADKTKWSSHIHTKNMSQRDAAKLRRFQPFFRIRTKKRVAMAHPIPLVASLPSTKQLHPLSEIASFANDDKHRMVNAAVAFQQAVRMERMDISVTDCAPPTPNGFALLAYGPGEPPKSGNIVFRIPVVVTGPNPDLDFASSLAGYVSLRRWPLVATMEHFVGMVEAILRRFQPKPEGSRPTVP